MSVHFSNQPVSRSQYPVGTEHSGAKLEPDLNPQPDDRPLWNLLFGMWAFPAILVAHKLRLFELLGVHSCTKQEIREKLGIAERPAEALLMANTAFQLVQKSDGRFELTDLARTFLLEGSPTSFCGYLDFLADSYSLWSFENVRNAVAADAPQTGAADFFKVLEKNQQMAKGFIRAMHAQSYPASFEWPKKVDLSKSRVLLDIGAGSGAHAQGAAREFPHLHAIVFDLPPIARITEEYIRRSGLEGRIHVQPGNMWTDAFPPADVHFYGEVFHDWSREKAQFLARKSFESLPAGGLIILRELLADDSKTGPLSAAGYNITMLLVTQGQQFSSQEMVTLLTEVGFKNVQFIPTRFGYRSIVIASKPTV
jgi:cyclopropane fatty-acyl-phospholipid synthase-like methyltransferase